MVSDTVKDRRNWETEKRAGEGERKKRAGERVSGRAGTWRR
jgi:hypothetical protein